MDIQKLCEYPHNRYPTNIDISTRRIFIQRVRYEKTTTRTIEFVLVSTSKY